MPVMVQNKKTGEWYNAGGSWLSKGARKRILERGGNRCAYCGATENLTVDHVIARNCGGALKDENNLIPACKPCNSARGDKGVRAFVAYNKAAHGVDPRGVIAGIARQIGHKNF
jgi:5-methylcytosine-specific restriction endonuclease McrA